MNLILVNPDSDLTLSMLVDAFNKRYIYFSTQITETHLSYIKYLSDNLDQNVFVESNAIILNNFINYLVELELELSNSKGAFAFNTNPVLEDCENTYSSIPHYLLEEISYGSMHSI